MRSAPELFKIMDANLDCMLVVSNRTNFMFAEAGSNFDLGVRIGDPVIPDSVTENAINTKGLVKRSMDRTNYGIPYIGTAIPIIEENGEVSGAITVVISTDRKEKLSTASANLAAMTEEISASAETFSQNALHLSSANAEILDMMNILSERTQSIETINQMIAYIAQETNLIGLNASIEAARAGENGRTFGIVAAEVRRLAEQSADSTKHVVESTKAVLDSVSQVTSQAQKILGLGEEQTGGAEELASAIQEINRLVLILNELSEQI